MGTTHPQFKAIQYIIPKETVGNTQKTLQTLLTAVDSTAKLSGSNITLKVLSGNLWFRHVTGVTAANGAKLEGIASIDLNVAASKDGKTDGDIFVISDATGADIDVIIWREVV